MLFPPPPQKKGKTKKMEGSNLIISAHSFLSIFSQVSLKCIRTFTNVGALGETSEPLNVTSLIARCCFYLVGDDFLMYPHSFFSAAISLEKSGTRDKTPELHSPKLLMLATCAEFQAIGQ